jgi:hypothetical protein
LLHISVRHVHPEQVVPLREWLAEVDGPRRREAIETLRDEGVHHEVALLLDGPDGPVLVYVMEVEDLDRARSAVRNSSHAIDAEHKRVLRAALGDNVRTERLLDLRPAG